MSDIERFMLFAFNFKHNFIDEVWHAYYVKEHLQSKFNALCTKYNGTHAFFEFYIYLDKDNRTILENWIINNYEG